MRSRAITVAVLSIALMGAGHHHARARHDAHQPPAFGLASWYGGRFNGRRTAMGDRFDERRLTAASRTLALGSCAELTNTRNMRQVRVRITDRGPYVRGRFLDVSRGTARVLEFEHSGTAHVAVRPVACRFKGPRYAGR